MSATAVFSTHGMFLKRRKEYMTISRYMSSCSNILQNKSSSFAPYKLYDVVPGSLWHLLRSGRSAACLLVSPALLRTRLLRPFKVGKSGEVYSTGRIIYLTEHFDPSNRLFLQIHVGHWVCPLQRFISTPPSFQGIDIVQVSSTNTVVSLEAIASSISKSIFVKRWYICYYC